MNEIREIVTKAVVAKGKKAINITHRLKTDAHPYSILGCWIINHEFEASKVDDIVKIDGEFEVNLWYSTNNNSKTDVIREKIPYHKDIKTKQVVKNYLENSEDILAKILQHPTATNAKILGDEIELDITIDILAEVIGETKMQVTVFTNDGQVNDDDDIEDLDIEVNEDFLGSK